jgi:hypothetical protein
MRKLILAVPLVVAMLASPAASLAQFPQHECRPATEPGLTVYSLHHTTDQAACSVATAYAATARPTVDYYCAAPPPGGTAGRFTLIKHSFRGYKLRVVHYNLVFTRGRVSFDLGGQGPTYCG